VTEPLRPFCEDKRSAAAFDRWAARLEAAGVELGEADRFVVGLLASREVRLEGLVAELRREKDAGRRLRLIAAERLAAQDMAKALDQAERTYGSAVEGAAAEVEEQAATGTEGGRVLAFAPAGGLSAVAQRIAAAVEKSSRPLTKDALRRRVAGSQDDFLRGVKEAERAGAIVRSGSGRRGSPFTFQPGERI
jgi:hypothetical protein